MTNEQIARQIRKNLKAKFPDAVFQVSYADGDLSIRHIGGNNHKDDYPTQEQGAAAMVEVIRQTLPDFQLMSYE